MAVYVITGSLGSGKTLCSVGLIQGKLAAGLPVATNIDLFLEHLLLWQNKTARVYRLPDNLRMEHLEAIGSVDNGYDEEKNGLVVLDEGGLMLNSRDYKNASHADFYKWGIHSRKLGWDLAILIQNYDTLDKQIRENLGEMVARCSRWDRVSIPWFGWLLRLFGFRGTFPRIHQVQCRNGNGTRGMVAWQRAFRGADLYQAYDTKQTFDPDSDQGIYMYLTPWHVKGRFYSRWDEIKESLIKMWGEYANIRVGRLSVFFSALVLGSWAHATISGTDPVAPAPVEINKTVKESSYAGGIKVPSSISTEPEDIEEEPVDPWLTAYISGYAGNIRTHQYKYSFRSVDGEPLKVPPGTEISSISGCNALLKTHQNTYRMKCKPK